MADYSGTVTAHPVGGQYGAIVTYRDNHLMVGAPQLRDTLTDRSRPSDLLLAALVTDCLFVSQECAREMGITLNNLHISAQWSKGDSSAPLANAASTVNGVDRSLNAIRLRLTLSGPDATQANMILNAVKERCRIVEILTVGVLLEFELNY